MKNFFKLLGIISMVLVIGFSMVSCGGDDDGGDDDDDGGGGGGGSGSKWTAVADSKFDGGYNLTALAYGGNKFVAGGNFYGKMAYSADGVTWTTVEDSKLEYSVTAIVWGNNKFVAGSYRKMAYSADGVTWTAVEDSKIDGQINAIAYGNNKFVAVGDNGKMATSPDGVTWTAVADSTIWQYYGYGRYERAAITSIAWGNNKFVAVAPPISSSSFYGKMAYSDDGETWIADGSTSGSRIAYVNGKFFRMGYNNFGMSYSTDGETWTNVEDTKFDTSNPSIYAIAYGNNKFVTVGGGGQMAYSADGVTWTKVEDSAFGTTYISAITYGNNKFVAVGGAGKIAWSK